MERRLLAILSGWWAVFALLAQPVRAQEPSTPCKIVRDQTYVRRGDTPLRLDAYIPHGKGPFPAVMLVHGGAWRFGGKWQVGHHGITLAKRGYAAFSISYRLAPAHKFPAQIDDCRDALKYIRRQAAKYKVDATHVGAAGYSAGGHLVCLLAVTGRPAGKQPNDIDTRLQAIVAGGAPCDFRRHPSDSRSLAYWLGATRGQNPDVYRTASPAAFVSKDTPPIFFYNGTRDNIVPIQWTLTMYNAVKKANVPTEMFRVEDAGHLAAFLNPQCIDRACRFLDDHLKK